MNTCTVRRRTHRSPNNPTVPAYTRYNPILLGNRWATTCKFTTKWILQTSQTHLTETRSLERKQGLIYRRAWRTLCCLILSGFRHYREEWSAADNSWKLVRKDWLLCGMERGFYVEWERVQGLPKQSKPLQGITMQKYGTLDDLHPSLGSTPYMDLTRSWISL